MSNILVPFFTCDNMNQSLLDAYRQMIVVDSSGNVGLRVFSDSSGSSDCCLTEITDAVIISAITDENSWTDGVFTGSTLGLTQFNIYTDTDTFLTYFYDGTTLVRWQSNSVTI